MKSAIDSGPASQSPRISFSRKFSSSSKPSLCLAHEVDTYLWPESYKLVVQYWFTPEAERNPGIIAKHKLGLLEELNFLEKEMRGDWLAGPLSIADFTLYPFLASMFRIEAKKEASLGISAALPPKIAAWRKRFESLPYFQKCLPPHWK